MGAIREENKLAFFLPEWVARMDQCFSMGPPAARELYSIFKAVITKLSEYSVYSSEWSERARDNCLCVSVAKKKGRQWQEVIN